MREARLQSLFDDVWARPDDDGVRLVLADALLERGDPRGEFIALQLMNGGAGTERAVELLAAHGQAWVPEGVDVTRAAFRRGFVSACIWERDVDPADERWRTIEVISCALRPRRLNFERSPLLGALPALQVIEGVDPRVLFAMNHGDVWPKVQTLSTSLVSVDDLVQGARKLNRFPSLRQLRVDFSPSPEAFEQLVGLYGARLERLRCVMPSSRDATAFQRTLERHAPHLRVELGFTFDTALHVTLSAQGPLRAPLGSPRWALHRARIDTALGIFGLDTRSISGE
ncbi:MAG: TIGR02996 domain-containing protein [Archangium sp.]|nr:TIGR02996 domain-containing protein [Archangium sp.]